MSSPVPVLCAVLLLAVGASADNKVIVPLEQGKLPADMMQNNTAVKPVQRDKKVALETKFMAADWPNIYFSPSSGTWDWSGYSVIEVDMYNPDSAPVAVHLRVDNAGADGVNNCATAAVAAEPKKWSTLRLHLSQSAPELWGMRGVPGLGSVSLPSPLDLSRITAFQVFLNHPEKERTLFISNFRLVRTDTSLTKMPFVDRFGQYKNVDWPGKLKSEKDFELRRTEEQKALRSTAIVTGRDKFGGWADGPKLNGTGWFRTQKVDGKWWLVTPEGHLFFSIGVDTVGTGDATFIDKREKWFENLPSKDDPKLGKLYWHASGAVKMAEQINGQGTVYNFYNANLIRKYGDNWLDSWRDVTYSRFEAWGFNTIGNWSRWDILDKSPIPFVATIHIGGDFKHIEGSSGWWGKMIDVYDAKFTEAAEQSIAPGAEHFAGNPMCIGFFVDNELSWGGIFSGSLASPPDQPCRVAQVKELEKKYNSIENLNKAWSTNAKSWDELRAPEHPNDTCRRDLDEFCYAFAYRYFEIVKSALRKHAPNQLYLGCRFAGDVARPIALACADVADVVSYNIYTHGVDSAKWTGANDLGKPIIIGEFHFGATDWGMLHPGLVDAVTQKGRGEDYTRYVESVADCPAFVGCHWFEYVDEPLTGRYFDGENYNIGLVDVTDTPYLDLTAAATKVNFQIYTRRAGIK